MVLDKRVEDLERDVSKLKKRKKDRWDKMQILIGLLIPIAVVYAGNRYAQSMKSAELQTQETIAEQQHDVAEVNARVGQVAIISSFFDALLSDDPSRKKLATEAILIALPKEGPRLVKAVSQIDTSEVVRNFAVDALSNRRSDLVAQLFSESSVTRQEGYSALISGWGDDSSLIPELLQYARDDSTNLNGVFNTLVLLSHMQKQALVPHQEDIRVFSFEVEDNGDNTKQRAEKLRSRLPY
jgi:hypothetical protein